MCQDNNSIKVEAIIWEIKEGKPTKIKALNTVFVPEKQTITQPISIIDDKPEPVIKIDTPIKTVPDTSEEIKTTPPDIYNKEKKYETGKIISTLSNNNIYENVLTEVKNGLKNGESNFELITRLLPYYPGKKPASVKVYLHYHKKFIGEGEFNVKGKRITGFLGSPIFTNILEKAKLCTDKKEIENLIKSYYPDLKKKSISKYAHVYYRYINEKLDPHSPQDGSILFPENNKALKLRKPKGALDKDDVYNIWILENEYKKVKRAINKWGFKATTKSLSKATNMKENRVRAILHMMQKKNDIYTTQDEYTPVYHLVDKNNQKK